AAMNWPAPRLMNTGESIRNRKKTIPKTADKVIQPETRPKRGRVFYTLFAEMIIKDSYSYCFGGKYTVCKNEQAGERSLISGVRNNIKKEKH
ncbi:MAG: hypothetical protein ILP22_05720, partial [Oscillospiraceae bacterium]|nr:hypothetical protein [Oscillospiraceae bacterium]